MLKNILLGILLLFSISIDAEIFDSSNPQLKMERIFHNNTYFIRILNYSQYRLFCRVQDQYNGYIYYSFYTPAARSIKNPDGQWVQDVGKSGWYVNPINDFTYHCNYA